MTAFTSSVSAIDGRLVVAELKSSRTPDTEITAIKYAAMASRILPESLADQYARFQSRRQLPVTVDEALAELQGHAPDLSYETLRRPRVVLLARDFSPVVTASVVWLSEMGLDLSLVQISAFRSYVYGQSGTGSGNVPMIAVNQIYPLREIEEFTTSPERQRAKEMAEAKRRVQDASTVRRLVNSELVADGTIFTFSPPSDLGFDLRNQLEEWLHEDPARRTAYWQNNLAAPLVWDVDKSAYTPAALARHIVEEATGLTQDVFGTQWWRDPAGWTLVELAGPISGGRGALYRDYWSRWLEVVRLRHPEWTRMSTLPAQNFITLPATDQGHPLRAGLRCRRAAAVGLHRRPRLAGGERGAVRGDRGAAGRDRVAATARRSRGSGCPNAAPTASPTTARATSPRPRTTPSTSTGWSMRKSACAVRSATSSPGPSRPRTGSSAADHVRRRHDRLSFHAASGANTTIEPGRPQQRRHQVVRERSGRAAPVPPDRPSAAGPCSPSASWAGWWRSPASSPASSTPARRPTRRS